MMSNFFINKIFFYYVPLLFDLTKVFISTALLTACIETCFFFFFFKYDKKFLSLVFVVNIVSNLVLNIWLSFANINYGNIAKGEISVLIFEYLLFLLFINEKKKIAFKLFILTLFANILSYATGLLLYGLF